MTNYYLDLLLHHVSIKESRIIALAYLEPETDSRISNIPSVYEKLHLLILAPT